MARKSRKNDTLNEITVSKSNFTINTAFYIRLSVEDNKNRGNSIEHQQMLLRNFVAVNPEFQVVKTYIDNGKTGTNFERPAFQEIIQNIEAGKIQCVIVKDLSRLGRNYIDTSYYIQSYFPAYHVRFLALNENFDTEKEDSNNILLPVLNMINESYALDTSKKIKEQATRDRKAGKFIGARAPYGYKKSPDDCHKLIVDEETAPIVKQIFQWVLEGVSLEKIALLLNEANILTPSFYERKRGIIRKESSLGQGYWSTFTIIHIIENETYTGDMVQGKSTKIGNKQIRTDKKDWIIVKNTHEAIISKEIFKKAQQIRTQIDKKSKSKNKIPYTENILKGKVYCGYCRHAMYERLNKNTIFLCRHSEVDTSFPCYHLKIEEKEVEEIVFQMILKQIEIIKDTKQINNIDIQTNQKLELQNQI